IRNTFLTERSIAKNVLRIDQLRGLSPAASGVENSMISAIRLAAMCALCFGANAAILSVSAMASAQPGDFAFHSDSKSVSDVFQVLVTGGVGEGTFTPDITLQGETNDSLGSYLLLGGFASTNWPQTVQVGDPVAPAQTAPNFSCGFNPQCDVSFTFGV